MKKTLLVAILLLAFGLQNAFAAPNTPISLRLVNADVSTVIRTMASMGEVSVVVDDAVTGKITLELDSVPFEQALDIVTKSKGLAIQKIGNTIIVSTPEKINKGFGAVQIVHLNYAKAEDVKKSLALIVPEDKIRVDTASNTLLFSGTPTESIEVQRAVAELDKQLAQVIIEAEVIEIYRNSLKDLGISWDWKTIPYDYPESETTTTSSGTTTTTEKEGYERVVLFDNIGFGLQAALHAKVDKGEGKVLAKPRIMALNNKDAKIHIGTKIPVVETGATSSGEKTKTTTYIDVGIKLDVTPQISDNETITSKVKTEVSDAKYNQTAQGYEISTRQSETTVRLKDSETLVIGGLYSTTENKSMIKVPFLGDIPLLGNLFKSSNNTKRDTEVIVLLTPKIVK